MKNIENTRERIYKKGEFLFKEGDQGEELFIIQSGEVRVYRSDKEKKKVFELGVFKKGSVVGEMSLFDNTERSATAEANTDTRVIYIDKPHFEKQVEKVPPWLASIIKIIIKRLRDTTQRIKDDTLDDYLISVIGKLFFYIFDKHKTKVGGEECVEMSVANREITGILDVKLDILSNFYDILIKRQIIKIEKGKILMPNADLLALFVKFKRSGAEGVMGARVSNAAMDLLNSLMVYGRKFGIARGKGVEINADDFTVEFEKVNNRPVEVSEINELENYGLVKGLSEKGEPTDYSETMPGKIIIEDKDKIRETIEKYQMLKLFL